MRPCRSTWFLQLASASPTLQTDCLSVCVCTCSVNKVWMHQQSSFTHYYSGESYLFILLDGKQYRLSSVVFHWPLIGRMVYLHYMQINTTDTWRKSRCYLRRIDEWQKIFVIHGVYVSYSFNKIAWKIFLYSTIQKKVIIFILLLQLYNFIVSHCFIQIYLGDFFLWNSFFSL